MIYSFEPIFDGRSRILILGSMASVKSLEKGFYYMHPRNRFWSTLSKALGEPVPDGIEARKKWLLDNNIALMDIIYSCNRSGSLDSEIRDIVPNDLTRVLSVAKDMQGIYCKEGVSRFGVQLSAVHFACQRGRLGRKSMDIGNKRNKDSIISYAVKSIKKRRVISALLLRIKTF